MNMKLSVSKIAILVVIFIMLMAGAFSTSAFASGGDSHAKINDLNKKFDSPLPNEITQALSDYSEYLATGKTSKSSLYSDAMVSLIQDRRNFYQEYLETGLYTQFIGLKSSYVPSTDTFVEINGEHHKVMVMEVVTLFGESKISSADDYPLVKSGRWALSHTNNETVKKAILNYIQNYVDSVNLSIEEGIEVEVFLKHEITIDIDKGKVKIIKDTFSDKSEYNPEGIDNIEWVDGKHKRVKSDLTKMPNYVFFNTPIELLGQQLLNDYSPFASQPLSILSYSHGAAATYSRTWVKNTTLTCAPGVYQDHNNYNNSHYPTWYDCADCANYASQALKAGGFMVLHILCMDTCRRIRKLSCF